VNRQTEIADFTTSSASHAFHMENVYPCIDDGRFPVKRIVGEPVEVWADVYRDGHDVTAAALIWRRERDSEWRRTQMTHHGNDRWFASFAPEEIGRHFYAIEAWTDEFATWRRGFELKQKAGTDVTVDAMEGAGLLTKADATDPEAAALISRQSELFSRNGDATALLTDELKDAMAASQVRPRRTQNRMQQPVHN